MQGYAKSKDIEYGPESSPSPSIESNSSFNQRKPRALQKSLTKVESEKQTVSREKAEEQRLLSHDQLPPWYQDNEYIHHGYRPVSNSIAACFHTWRYIHNETFNIYSHLISAIFFLLLQGVFSRLFERQYPAATALDRLIFGIFLFSAALTLSTSTTYHTMMNHSHNLHSFWLRLDFAGIIILILGSFISGIYAGFYCNPELQRIYWSMV